MDQGGGSGASELMELYRAARRNRGLAVLEGVHALKHAIRFGAMIEDVRTRDADALGALAERLAPDVATRIVDRARSVPDDTFAGLAPRAHPTGVIALARRPALDLPGLLAAAGPAPLVLLERPTHHGNIGAVVRVAAAAGAAGVLVTGPHDPWHPSSLRGGAGLQFALPVSALTPEDEDAVLDSGRPVVALDPEGEPLGTGAGADPRAVLVFGSERSGVSERILARVDRSVAIPMRPGVSSLNLATAVAATLYLSGGGMSSWK